MSEMHKMHQKITLVLIERQRDCNAMQSDLNKELKWLLVGRAYFVSFATQMIPL